MLYRLSKLIPVPMRTVYTEGGSTGQRCRATWTQWRGRIWAHHITWL